MHRTRRASWLHSVQCTHLSRCVCCCPALQYVVQDTTKSRAPTAAFGCPPTLLQYVVKDKAAADKLAKQLVFTQLSK